MRYQYERGQTLPFIAMIVGLLLGLVGLAVDVGYVRYQQRLQQTAADSAAIAGAGELFAGTATTILNAARKDASNNGFTHDGSKIVVKAFSPPTEGAYANSTSAVEATVAVTQPTFFMKVLGVASVPVVTRAVAITTANDNGCLYSLSTTANTNFNKNTVTAAQCSIVINGTANFNGSNITAASVDCTSSGACSGLSSPAPTITLPVSDPCFQIAGCASLTRNPPNIAACVSQTYAGGNFANPGCFSGLTLSGTGTVTFNPGLYIINGPADFGKMTVTGTGVTFYITAAGSLNLNQVNATLSACTSTCSSGAVSNVLFYQVPANSGGPNFNKVVATNFSGLLYFPTASVNFNKDLGTGYTVLVFASANMNKGTYNFPGSGAGASIIKSIVLGE